MSAGLPLVTGTSVLHCTARSEGTWLNAQTCLSYLLSGTNVKNILSNVFMHHVKYPFNLKLCIMTGMNNNK